MAANWSSYLLDFSKLCIWLVLLAVVFTPLERWFALAKRPISRATRLTDVGFYFLNGLLPAAVVSVAMSMVVMVSMAVLPKAYYDWTASLPLAVLLPVALVVSELGFYWGHRWTHEIPFLWQFHATHHRPEHIQWLVNSRGHPIDMIFVRLCGLTPLYALGITRFADPQGNMIASLAIIVGATWGYLIHANVRWRIRWLEPIIATPFFHHWHHSREKPINRNYAAMFPVMDRLFGTYVSPATWPKSYGVYDEAVEEAEGSARRDHHPELSAHAPSARPGAASPGIAEAWPSRDPVTP